MAIRYGKEKNPFDELVSFINSNRIGSKEEVRLRKIIDRIVDSKLHQPTVSGTLMHETIYLLRKSQPDNCSEWIEDVGDCGKISCDFCRIDKCISELERNDR